MYCSVLYCTVMYCNVLYCKGARLHSEVDVQEQPRRRRVVGLHADAHGDDDDREHDRAVERARPADACRALREGEVPAGPSNNAASSSCASRVCVCHAAVRIGSRRGATPRALRGRAPRGVRRGLRSTPRRSGLVGALAGGAARRCARGSGSPVRCLHRVHATTITRRHSHHGAQPSCSARSRRISNAASSIVRICLLSCELSSDETLMRLALAARFARYSTLS